MTITYPHDQPHPPHAPIEDAPEKPFVPVYARDRRGARSRKGGVKAWMIMAPVAVLVLGGATALLVMGPAGGTGRHRARPADPASAGAGRAGRGDPGGRDHGRAGSGGSSDHARPRTSRRRPGSTGHAGSGVHAPCRGPGRAGHSAALYRGPEHDPGRAAAGDRDPAGGLTPA